MKKLLASILAITMMMSLCACGGGNEKITDDDNNTDTKPQAAESSESVKPQVAEPSESAKPQVDESSESAKSQDVESYKLGDVVSTDIYELTLNSAEFTIALNNAIDDERFTPKEYDPQVDNNNPYVAPIGHTYVAFSYTVNNLNRTSSEFHDGSCATVKYNEKKYSQSTDLAYFLYDDKSIMNTNGQIETEKSGEWYSHPSKNFLLDVGAKETRRAYIEVDADIEDLTEDVEITFNVPDSDGEKIKFTYLVTAEDRTTYDTPEIEITLDLALTSFTEDAGIDYFVSHIDEYSPVSGEQISNIANKKWDVDYVTDWGYWSGTFVFEDNGKIKDDYGYANERTWEINGDMIVIDGEIECEMKMVMDGVFLLTNNGAPYLLMQ